MAKNAEFGNRLREQKIEFESQFKNGSIRSLLDIRGEYGSLKTKTILDSMLD
jgi:hypothetical protein